MNELLQINEWTISGAIIAVILIFLFRGKKGGSDGKEGDRPPEEQRHIPGYRDPNEY